MNTRAAKVLWLVAVACYLIGTAIKITKGDGLDFWSAFGFIALAIVGVSVLRKRP